MICQQMKNGRLGFIKDDWDGKNTAERDTPSYVPLCVCKMLVSTC